MACQGSPASSLRHTRRERDMATKGTCKGPQLGLGNLKPAAVEVCGSKVSLRSNHPNELLTPLAPLFYTYHITMSTLVLPTSPSYSRTQWTITWQ